MSQAAAPGLRLVGAPPPPPSLPALRLVGERRNLGRRLVGITTLLGVLALAVLLGLAVFHSVLAEGQYRLSGLEEDIALERQELVALQFRLETMTSPSEVELMAQGVLGLRSATEPVDLTVDPSYIGATARASDDDLGGPTTDWLATKPLLSDR